MCGCWLGSYEGAGRGCSERDPNLGWNIKSIKKHQDPKLGQKATVLPPPFPSEHNGSGSAGDQERFSLSACSEEPESGFAARSVQTLPK
mmetsp:Transcript_27232/g.49133  ORF Transcript_27232/g.49133 Transcript_27232/m.49133 type:complete len:89 (+) Transcript_27232:77-343(+)